MQEGEQFAPTESGVQESEAPIEGQTVAADTTETVAETDEQKNQRELEERQKRSERASRGIQKRFDELTAEKHAALRQVEQLTAIVQQALGQQRPSQAPEGEPQRRPDEAYEDWVARKAEWRAEQKAQALLREELTKVQRQQSEAEQQRAVQTARAQFEARMSEFAAKQQDWDEVVASNDDVNIPDAAAGLIHMDPDGPAILYAIGKNPALAAQLNGRNPFEQAMVLGQIKATLKAAPQVSKAPVPGKPVGSRGGPVDNSPSDQDDMATWLKKRNAQLRGQ